MRWFGSTILLVCAFFQLSANEAFYAISSLRFFLDEGKSAGIKCDEIDLIRLWHKAETDNAVFNQIAQAQTIFYSSEKKEAAALLLEGAWETIYMRTFPASAKKTDFYPNFSDNSLFSDEIRAIIAPYLLPLNHPMKPFLDEIFVNSRAIENDEAFALAGFKTISRYMRVAKHALLPGYLLKVFLDSEKRLHSGKRPGWLRLVDRCEGMMNIKKLIEKEKMQHFVVPEKMIYPLPMEPIPQSLPEKEQQLAVLLVTDMDLTPHAVCREAWKTKITHQHLEELYSIISHGYASTYLTANIAYTNQGKFACIDTEFPQRKLDFDKVRHYLSDEMVEYWDELVRLGGHSPSLQLERL